ncbi:MAG TPA: hypothetical protein VJN90_01910 [Candidatus Acidoferrales bacterium]|nr:hypothetical protein [Candidatus Acidoferrales bacterium]
MEWFEFLTLSLLNLGLMAFIIRRWGIASAEGFCMAYLGMAVMTDNLELVFHYVFSPDALPLGYRELDFRIHPTVVHVVGLLVLITALSVVNLKPRPIARFLDATELLHLREIGIGIAIVGLILAGIALYLVGAMNGTNFYSNLNAFRSEALPFGGFWYRGADIAVFGMALTLPSFERKTGRFFGVLTAMMFVSFFLRTNKGGLEEPILWAGMVLLIYNRALFKFLLNFRMMALALAIAFAGMGAKTWFLPNVLHQPRERATMPNLVQMAQATAATRWGDDSLYRGYCQFVNTLPDHRYLFEGSKVGVYALTSWIPRFVYRNKPDHPFRGLGFMMYSDFHSFPMETPAPLLVGSMMADNGTVSLVEYLFATGLFLGWFRRATARGSGNLYWHVGYAFFVLFGGISADEGILGLVYTLLLGYGVIAAAYLLISLKNMVTSSPRTGLTRAGSLVAEGD